MNLDEYRDPKSIIREWIETSTERDIKNPSEPEAITTNFAHISDNAKIMICDTIIDQAKDVFGPTGGYYISRIGSHDNQANNRVRLLKSKDGHNFFKSIEMINNQAQAIMTGIQGYTEYISDVDNVETSKDGTTSLAMIGSSLGKFLLTRRELLKTNGDPLNIRNTPSTIYNIVFDLIKERGTKLIADSCVSIYDKETNNYTEEGYENLMKALETTTDNDPVLLETFRNMIDFAREKSYDIRKAHLGPIEYLAGPPSIKINFKTGFQTPGTEIDRTLSAGFMDKNSVMFILDGFISIENESLFMIELENFINKYVATLKINDNYIFDMGEDSFDLVLLVTRTPETLVERYKAMHAKGITKVVIENGKSKNIVIKPRFITIRNDEYFEVHYSDIKEMFGTSIIDISLINKYITSHRDFRCFNNEKKAWSEAKKIEGIDISHMFPVIKDNVVIKSQFEIVGEKRYDEINSETPIIVPLVDFKTELNEKNEPTVIATMHNVIDLYNNMGYDGRIIYILPSNPEIDKKGREIRESLIRTMESYSSDTTEDTTNLKYRIDMFNSISMNPVISAMSDAERFQLQTLYEDALGIFFSVHDHGVMPGANTFFIKKWETLYKDVMDIMKNKVLTNTAEKQKKKYLEFTDLLLQSIRDAYIYVYGFLDEDSSDHLYELIHTKDILTTFNVVTGRWEKQVIESARTTRDVFVASLSIAKDLLLIRRIKIGKNDLRDMIVGNRYKSFHPMNLVKSEDSETIKNLKTEYNYKINELGGY